MGSAWWFKVIKQLMLGRSSLSWMHKLLLDYYNSEVLKTHPYSALIFVCGRDQLHCWFASQSKKLFYHVPLLFFFPLLLYHFRCKLIIGRYLECSISLICCSHFFLLMYFSIFHKKKKERKIEWLFWKLFKRKLLKWKLSKLEHLQQSFIRAFYLHMWRAKWRIDAPGSSSKSSLNCQNATVAFHKWKVTVHFSAQY